MRATSLCAIVVCAGLTVACGKKGPPLPPLARVPAAPTNVEALRIGDQAYISFVVPSANVSGQTPADVSEVELYAYTGTAAPSGPDLTEVAEQVGNYPVQPVLPPPPEPPPGAPPLPPGFAQGATAVVTETLVPDARVPTRSPAAAGEGARGPAALEPESPERELRGPLVGPTVAGSLRRHYFLVASGARGRSSAPSSVVWVPLDEASGEPGVPTIDYSESGMTISWTPAENARAAPAAGEEPGLLPSRPLVAPPAPTQYHVYEVPPTLAKPDPFALAVPTPLSKQPVADARLEVPGPVRFGEPRCFVVRAVDRLGTATVIGPPSPPGCVTPADTFPPAAPKELVAISGAAVINLIWEANAEPDLAGYLVLRGTAPDGTLQALTPAPIRETTYRDQTATPGVRFVYAVVAVDRATPANVSAQSNRVEEVSR